MTQQTHSALTTHSAPFSLTGSMVSASLTGTVADGIDPPELQGLISGNWVSLNPPVRFLSTEKGGTKQAKIPASVTSFRWTVPTGGHSVSTDVIST